MQATLTDSGPLVALLDRSDSFHHWAREQFNHIAYPIFTCEGAIAEVCHLLEDSGVPSWGALELIERKIVAIDFDLEKANDRVLALMKKYKDTPMDFVDACLVAMTERRRNCRLITIDNDFRIYRRFERQTIPLIFPS